MPGSKLILKASPLADAATCDLTRDRLLRAGMSAERLTLPGPTSLLSRHLA